MNIPLFHTFLKGMPLGFALILLLPLSSFSQINADFSSPNTEACGSLQTTFFDQSTSSNAIIDWAWDLHFNTSSQQNPGSIFTEPGSYTICLTVTDVNGNMDTECKEDFIVVFPSPEASFTMDNTIGCSPVIVNFTNTSISNNGNIVSFLWDVGGSAGVVTTTDSSLVVTSEYQFGGFYNASLTVEDEYGCKNTINIPNAINVGELTTPIVSTSIENSCELPWNVDFLISNPSPNVNYTWDFGNGEVGSGLNPQDIIFTSEGIFDVTIFMENGECKDTILLENYINTETAATIDLDFSTICAGNSVQFSDASLVDALSVQWDFGDGNFSTLFDPTHTYNNPGCYEVVLIRNTAECSDTAYFNCIDVLPNPIVTYNIENEDECLLPVDIVLHGQSNSAGSYVWTFDDGSEIHSFDENDPVITVDEYGVYDATLLFIDEFGCQTLLDNIEIDISPFEAFLPIAGPSGCFPLDFTLVDSIISATDIVFYEWTIGTPPIFSSNLAEPSFTLPDTGTYDVQLIAENVRGCRDTVFVQNYISVGQHAELDFIGSPLVGCVEVAKYFTNLSSQYIDEIYWQVGDQGYIYEENPEIVLNDAGVYDVTLFANHNGCKDSLTFDDYITILEPSSDYEIVYNCDDPYTVEILNRSIGADSLMWTLLLTPNDSILYSDSLFGSYTFPDRGNYVLRHYSKSFKTECEHIFTDTIRITDPIANYTLDTLKGCAPLTINIGELSQDAFQINYLSDDGVLDTIEILNSSITFNTGGILEGPMMIVTDIHECQDTFTLFDSVEVNQLIADISYNDIICVPDTAFLIDNSIDALGEVVDWDWKINGDFFTSMVSDTFIYIDSVGVYDLEFLVEDSWGCKDSLQIPMAITAAELLPDFTVDSLSCTFAPIHFKALGVTDDVSDYLWDFGDGESSTDPNPKHTYNSEGVYSICLTLFDGRGCSKMICKENIVTIKDPIAAFSGDPLSAFCPPLLTNFTNESVNSNQQIWNFGDNSGLSSLENPSHVFTQPGVFDITLIVEMLPQCKDTLVIPEYVKVEGPIASFDPLVIPSCIPIDVELFAESDGFYTYIWDYGNGVLDSVPDLVMTDTTAFFYDEPGKFTPKLIVVDSFGCTRSFAGDPIIVNEVELDFSIDQDPNCGPPLDIELQNLSEGSTEHVQYNWSIIGPESLSASGLNPTISVSQTGQYDVLLIANYDDCIDTFVKENYLEIADIPVVEFEIITDRLCENVDVEFQNTSSVGYGEFESWHWEFGDGDTSSVFQPQHSYDGLEGKTITLTGITDKGCESSFTASFDVLPSTIAHASPDTLLCIGDEIIISGSIDNLLEGGSFYWIENENMSCTDCYSPSVSPTSTTEYIIVGVHPNGCESRDTVLVEVIQSPGPELTLNALDSICYGETTVIDVINFDPDYTYIWNSNIPNQDCYLNCDSVIVNPEASGSFYVSVYNEFGCVKTDSVYIGVETSFEDFLLSTRGICEGESTTLSVTGGNNPSWQSESTVLCTDCEDIQVSPLSTQSYYALISSDLGCHYLDSIEVIVIPDSSTIAGSDREICKGESIKLNAVGYGNATWSGNADFLDSSAYHTIATLDESGNITLTMTFDECSQNDSLYVNVLTHAEITGKGDTICVGQEAILSAEGRATSFEWLMSSGENIMLPSIDVSPDTSTMYQVIGRYKTCIPDTADVLAFVHPTIDFYIKSNKYIIHLNDEIEISPKFDELRNYNFDWSPQDGLDCTDCPDPIISDLLENQEYELLITDMDSGCEAEYKIDVRFIEECAKDLFHTANVFSPNGDGINDMFLVNTKNKDEFISLQIFDRWGEFLFSSTDVDVGWDGKYKGTLLQPGVYVFKVELICPFTREEYVIFGDITILR